MANDLISRQAAIAELNEIAEMKNAILDSLNISDKRARDMIEAELGQINDDIDSIKNMPSAEPEIIRCRDCEHHSGSYCHYKYSYGAYVMDNHYCGWAERRTDD